MTMEDANSSFLSSAAREGPKLSVSQTFQEPPTRRKSYKTHGLRQTTCMQRQKTEHDAIASSKFWRRFCSGTNRERKKEHALRCSSQLVRELSRIQQQFNEIAESRQQQMSKDWRQLFRRRRQIDSLLLRWPDDQTVAWRTDYEHSKRRLQEELRNHESAAGISAEESTKHARLSLPEEIENGTLSLGPPCVSSF
jgi:hypothetical protein